MSNLNRKPKNNIFYNYSTRSLKVIKNARIIAVKQNFCQVHSGHLLLSIINAKESIASKILCKMYLVNEVEIKTEVINILALNKSLPIKTSLNCSVFSSQTLRVFTKARTEARKLKQNFISVDHLLLALLFETGGSAIVALCRCGYVFDLPDIRATLIEKMDKFRIASISAKTPRFILNKKFHLKLTKYGMCISVLSFVMAVICHKIYCGTLYIRGIYYIAKILEKRFS
jgi:ATP-dependent Clp protease ATP-binding subunit ClpA